MSYNNSSNNNRVVVPEAKEAMNKFKMEVASEIDVPLSNGNNGNLTSAQNGSVGGFMVKIKLPKRHAKFERNKSRYESSKYSISYTYSLAI